MSLNHIFIATIPTIGMLALAWALVSSLLTEQKVTARIFSASCFVTIAGLIYGYSLGSKIQLMGFVPLITSAINVSLILFKRGLRNLISTKSNLTEEVALTLITVLVGSYMHFLPSPSYLSSILMATIASVVLIRSSVEISNPIREEFGQRIHLLVTIPMSVFGCIYAMVGIAVMTNPKISDFTLSDEGSISGLLAIVLGNLIILNLGFASLMISRTVKNARKLAMQDPLTRLANRQQVEIVLELENVRAKRSKKPFSLLLIDLDHFNDLNNKFGQVVGDEVIIAVSQILKETARLADTVGRAGGEEFIVVLPDTDVIGAEKAAERFRKAVEGLNVMINRNQIKTTASIGVVDYHGSEPVCEMLLMADRALHQAKSTGRNKYVIFDRTAVWAVDPIGGRSHHKVPTENNPYFVKQHNQRIVGTEVIQESINDIMLRS